MSRKGLNIYKRKGWPLEARYIKSRNALGKPKYGYLYASSYREVRCDLQHTLQLQGKPSGSEERTRNSTFELVSMEWLDAFSINFKESTYIRYRTLIECYLMPSFQTVKIEKITKEMVRKLCKHLELHGKKDKTGLSPKTISDVLSVLRRILNYAGTLGIFVDSKVLDIRVKQTQKSLPILSLPEQMILQQYLEEHPDALNLGILLCLLTGIRIGELCALTWEKISISERNIYICQTMQRIQNRVPGSKKTHIEIASPKSSSANRNIPISNLLFGFLERYSLSHTGFFLSGSPSKFIEPRCIQQDFTRFWMPVDWKKEFHVLRHFCHTLCGSKNRHQNSEVRFLGHSSVTITMNRYVHPSLELKRETMEQLAILFPSNKPSIRIAKRITVVFAIIAEWATLRQKIIPTTHLCICCTPYRFGCKGNF